MPLSSKRRTCQLFEVTSIELFFCISCLCAIHYSTLPNCWGIHLHYSTLPQLLGRFTSNWYRFRLYTTLCKDLQRGFQVFACYVVCAKFGRNTISPNVVMLFCIGDLDSHGRPYKYATGHMTRFDGCIYCGFFRLFKGDWLKTL